MITVIIIITLKSLCMAALSSSHQSASSMVGRCVSPWLMASCMSLSVYSRTVTPLYFVISRRSFTIRLVTCFRISSSLYRLPLALPTEDAGSFLLIILWGLGDTRNLSDVINLCTSA